MPGRLEAGACATPTRSGGACSRRTPRPSCVGVIAWMHTFSPAKMWIAGLDALRKPLLHLHTQADAALPWATIDMDFMNLNQSAHGDREFGYIERGSAYARKTVAGHATTPRCPRGSAAWARAALRRGRARSAAAGPLRRQHARRRRDRGRQGRGADALRRLGQHLRRQRPRRARSTRPPTPTSTRSSPSTSDLLRGRRRAACPAARGTTRCATPRASRPGCAGSSSDGGFGAFTANFEDLGGLRQLPGIAVQRLMADGYGFGGEGDWKTARCWRT